LWLSVWDCALFMACSALALFFSIAGRERNFLRACLMGA
jgi:hypothetical protein